MELEQVQACNCAYGCPCQFNSYPTDGRCEGVNGYRVRKGHFSGTELDGVAFALAGSWPKAIHEGNGIGAYYIDARTTKAQRQALEAILSGTHGGGVFELAPQTLVKVHPMRIAKIRFDYDGPESRFEIEGIGAVRSTAIRNPVTKEPFESAFLLPGGFEFKKAYFTAAEEWWLRDGDLQMGGKDTCGIVGVSTITEKGCIR